jgi:glycerol-3-phosphate dehydrogenase
MTESKATIRPNIQALKDRPTRCSHHRGGINGIATFRDLALQGVDVALVERGDYVSGASSASSHMIHGGVRYLENGEFRLVKESVTERNRLVRNAPHFVKPAAHDDPDPPTISGILTAPSVCSSRTVAASRASAARCSSSSASSCTTPSRATGVPCRATASTAVAARASCSPTSTTGSATPRPTTTPRCTTPSGSRSTCCATAPGKSPRAPRTTRPSSAPTARRSSSATPSPARSSLHRRRRRQHERPVDRHHQRRSGHPTRFMGGTKGSHIVLENAELLEATRGNEIFFEASDGRIVLIYPLKGRVMVGTTDIDADPSTPTVCTDDEISYFFDLIAQVFPHIAVDREQIVYTFSGIRPLPRHDDVAPGFVSRDYRIEKARPGRAPAFR